MEIEKMQEIIDQTDYWDMRILDINVSFFGDEVSILIENDDKTYWKLSFSSCKDVIYSTDADRRKIISVKDMKKSQLGYFGQSIDVIEAEKEGFYKVTLDLSIMEMQVVCRNINAELVALANVRLFWDC